MELEHDWYVQGHLIMTFVKSSWDITHIVVCNIYISRRIIFMVGTDDYWHDFRCHVQ